MLLGLSGLCSKKEGEKNRITAAPTCEGVLEEAVLRLDFLGITYVFSTTVYRAVNLAVCNVPEAVGIWDVELCAEGTGEMEDRAGRHGAGGVEGVLSHVH